MEDLILNGFVICIFENGYIVDFGFSTFDEALNRVRQFEAEDSEDDSYSPGFYSIDEFVDDFRISSERIF